jgi:large subunit ribosomal protein L25
MDQKIETNVDLEFIGESPAVKEMGGIFVTNIDFVEVQCLPGDLPGKIEVDISVIDDFDKNIYVKDLAVGEKVVILTDESVSVASVSAPRTKEELEGLDEQVDGDISQVEGIEEKDEKEEGGNGEAKKEAKKAADAETKE